MSKVFLLATGLILLVATSAPASETEIQQHYRRAQQALAAKQDAVAAREFREILRLDPRNASAHANLGVIAFGERNYAEASQEFRAALKLQPSLWNAKALLGMSEVRLGNRAGAQPLLESAFPHVEDPKLRTEVGLDLVSLYHESNRLDDAVNVLRALERAGAAEPATLYLAYRTYSDLAAQQLATLAKVAPESAQMHLVLAQAQMSQNDFPGAIAQYRKALAVDPQLPGIHFELGQAMLMNSTDEPSRREAEQQFQLALAANPTDAESAYMLGEIEWLRSNPEAALKDYEHALALRPDFVDARIAAGKALTRLGRPQEALEQLQQAIRLDPQNEVAHYRLAQAYRALGRTADAGRELALFRSLRSSHASVRDLYQQVQERREQTLDPGEPQ